MTATEANAIANTALALGGDLPRNQFGKVVAAYNFLADSKWVQDRNLARKIDRAFPNLVENYDSRGNWIGAVANENGWTP